MFTNPFAKKIVQISEECQSPVYVPFALGNDCYVLVQQDVRKIEDTRFLSYNRINQNGDLNPIDPAALECFLHFFKRINVDNVCQNSSTNRDQEMNSQPMDTSVTAIGKKLKWDKCSNTSTPFPFTYSRGTSTTEICYSSATPSPQQQHASNSAFGGPTNCTKKVSFPCETTEMKKPTSWLGAREQRKYKKMFNSYFS